MEHNPEFPRPPGLITLGIVLDLGGGPNYVGFGFKKPGLFLLYNSISRYTGGEYRISIYPELLRLTQFYPQDGGQ